jgi:hypothetical protein
VAAAVLGTHAWNLIVFGVFAVAVAVTLNWRNSRSGYWLNLLVVGGDDVGFIYAIVLPGYVRLGEGLSGPVLWVLAVMFSTVGVLANPGLSRRASS